MISRSFEMLNYLNEEFSSKMKLLYPFFFFNFSVRNFNIKIKGFIKNWIIVGAMLILQKYRFWNLWYFFEK